MEVFLARPEALLGRSDLRRAARSADPRWALHTTHMPLKRRSMGSDGAVPKGENHTPFSPVLIPSVD